MHCWYIQLTPYLPEIRVFVIIFRCVCNAYMQCMHCWYIHFTPNTLIQGFCHHSPVAFAKHACMHCWYIQLTPNYLKQSFCHYIPLCLQCIHVCIADTFTSHQIPWFRVFVMIIPLGLQSMHACIAATFNSHQVTWIRFFSLNSVVFAMHTCVHCWYIHFTPNTLIRGFHHHSVLHLQSMHACITDTFNSHQFTWIRVFCHYIPLCLQCIHACIADTFTLY